MLQSAAVEATVTLVAIYRGLARCRRWVILGARIWPDHYWGVPFLRIGATDVRQAVFCSTSDLAA
jgi:hypothetical protein